MIIIENREKIEYQKIMNMLTTLLNSDRNKKKWVEVNDYARGT